MNVIWLEKNYANYLSIHHKFNSLSLSLGNFYSYQVDEEMMMMSELREISINWHQNSLKLVSLTDQIFVQVNFIIYESSLLA